LQEAVGRGQFSEGLQSPYPSGQTMGGHDLPEAHGHTCLQANRAHYRHGGVNQSTCSIKEKIEHNYLLPKDQFYETETQFKKCNDKTQKPYQNQMWGIRGKPT